jgi:hypothetical protein
LRPFTACPNQAGYPVLNAKPNPSSMHTAFSISAQ